MKLLRRKPTAFDLPIEDIVLRVTAPEEYYEESRAAALSYWEQIQSYSRRNPPFRTSKRAIPTPDGAPEIALEMIEAASLAGVGPAFTLQGAMTDHVGRFLARLLPEVLVSCAGDHFVHGERVLSLPVYTDPGGGALKVLVDPAKGVNGVATILGRRQLPAETVDGLGVLASSCMLAEAAAAAVMAIVGRPDGMKDALDHLRSIPGVHGGVVVQGERIGMVGALEFAA